MSPSPRIRWTALVVLAAVLLLGASVLVAGFPDDDSDDSGPGPGPAAAGSDATVQAGWTADLAAVGPQPVLQRSDDVLAFVGTSGVVGLDRASGEQRWTTALPGRCAVSDPTADGVVAVLTGAACTSVTTLDLATGTRLWTSTLRTATAEEPELAVSDRTVTVVGECGAIERLRVSDGSRLATIVEPQRTSCDDAESVTDGRTVLVRRENDSTRGRILAFEADTGRRILDQPADGYAQEIGVVSSDPLVINADDVQGGAMMRSYDRVTGRPGRVLVRGSYPVKVVDAVAGVALATTQDDGNRAVVRAYDLAAGRPTWAHQLETFSSVIGSDDAGLVVTTPVETDITTASLVTLERLSRVDGSREELGTVDAGLVTRFDSRWLSGDFLGVLAEDGRLTSFAVPESGEAIAPPEGPGRPTVIPDEILDACSSIRPESLRTMGIRPSAPAPYDCTWHDYQGDSERRLSVQVRAGGGSYDAAEEEVARWVDQQQSQFKDAVYAPIFVTSPAATAVPGWADEAWVSQAFSPNGADSYTGVVVRSGTVAVLVEAFTEASSEGSGRVAGYVLQRAVLAVVADVVRGLGTEAAPPAPRGSSGPVGALPDVCSALADVAATSTGGVAPAPPEAARDPRRRIGACSWGDDLVVTAYAVPASLVDETSGAALAQAALTDACSIARPVRGVGSEACRYDYADDEGDYRSATLTVRSGNLLVEVAYGRDGSPGRAEISSTAVRVARVAVARLC